MILTDDDNPILSSLDNSRNDSDNVVVTSLIVMLTPGLVPEYGLSDEVLSNFRAVFFNFLAS